jgi:hypothetical protein
MNGLHLQALQWTHDGELSASDRCALLNTLMASSLPEIQLELIALMERIPMDLEMLTPDVSVY